MAIKFKSFAILMILMGAGIPLYISGGKLLASNFGEIGIVMTDNLNVRAETGEHGVLQKRLKKGTQVRIIKHEQGWLQILHDGQLGFIPDEAHLMKIIREKESETKRDNPRPAQKPESRIDALKKKVKDIDRKIEKSQSEVHKFSQQEIEMINSLNQVDLALNKSRKRLTAMQSEIVRLENKIAATTRISEDLMERIKTNEHYVAQRLAALYKLNRLGQIHVLASAETIQELFQRKKALEQILAYDQKIREGLEEDRTRLNKILSGLKNQKSEKRVLLAEHAEQLELMSQRKSERSRLLARIRNQKSLELAAIASFKKSAEDLDQKLISLTQKMNSASNEKIITLASITKYKGLLKMPVKGNISSLFGPYKDSQFNARNFRSGIDIEAEKGEPVRAVFSGKIVYSNWFKGYGNMIIIDHGTNYHTVYAHVEDFFKSKGDTVETGEVISTVGDTGSITGPKLHFEVRHHGKPLDPLKWLKPIQKGAH